MFGLGRTELIVIGVIVFLIFGAKRIPEIGKGLGGAIREFRQVKREISDIGEDNKDERVDQEEGQKKPPALESKLAEKVIHLLNNPSLRTQLITQALEKVESFSKSEMARNTLAQYRRLFK